MPQSRKRASRKFSRRPRHKYGGRRRLVGRRRRFTGRSTKQVARALDTQELEFIPVNVQSNESVQLSFFPRLLAIAKEYRYYRITKVQYRYQPTWNLASFGDTAQGIPNMYHLMDRSGLFNISTLPQMEAMGTRARKFKNDVNITYKPNIVQLSQFGISTDDPDLLSLNFGAPTFNQWLPTRTPANSTSVDPDAWSRVQYYGHTTWFQLDATMAPSNLGRCTLTAWVEFKDPIYDAIMSPVTTTTSAVVNTSVVPIQREPLSGA